VIGQVTRVHPLLAEVTLITDKEQRTPVEVVRNGLRAVIYGGGDKGGLDLSYTAANADVQADDLLVTSGIDGTYPPGLPVAKVTKIERDAAYSFAKITCVPAAGTDQNRQVLVLARETGLPAPPVETEPKTGPAPKQKRPRPGKI
jgi:rod shape-determining protein MreC